MKVRQTRRDLARLKTVLRQREMGGGRPVASAPTRPAPSPAPAARRATKKAKKAKAATPRPKRASSPRKTTRAKRSTK